VSVNFSNASPSRLHYLKLVQRWDLDCDAEVCKEVRHSSRVTAEHLDV
jgi:hypothetical protein